jgi:hypothetical protein
MTGLTRTGRRFRISWLILGRLLLLLLLALALGYVSIIQDNSFQERKVRTMVIRSQFVIIRLTFGREF